MATSTRTSKPTDSARSIAIPGPVETFGPIVVAVVLLALLPLWFSDSGSMMGVITEGVVFGSYVIAFNIIFGSTGQLFLCVGALAGLGGFSSAILSDRVGLPMIVAMVAAAAAAGAIGGVLSWVSVKRGLDTIFIGIVTLTFSLSFENFVLGRRDLTGGETGTFVDAGSDTLLRDRVPSYYVFLALLAVFLVLFRLLQRSRTGWAFRALRDDQLAAELSGVDVAWHRIFAGVVGSAMLGFTGALVAHSGRGFIGPSTFAFGEVDVRVLVMLALGGIGSLLGPVLGSALITMIDELLIDYAQLRLVLYGVILIALFLRFRQGLIPALTGFAGRLLRRSD